MKLNFLRNSRLPGRNHSDIRRGFSLNIGTVIFGVLFIYIVISIFLYMTATHVKSYQVTAGPLAKNQTYTGLAVYSEKVVKADTGGYVTYFAEDSAKVKNGGIVYGIGASKTKLNSGELTESTLKEISSRMTEFTGRFDSSDFHDVYSLKYSVESAMLNQALESSTKDASGSMTIGTETISTAQHDGIVVYATDGYESFHIKKITADDLNEKAYALTSLKTTGKIAAGDPVYKLITSEDWSLIIPMTSRQIVDLGDNRTFRVKFLKDGVTQTATMTILSMEDGSYYGKLDFSSGLIRYLDSRFIDIELVTNTETGLKIPVTSVVNKDFFTIPDEYATSGGDGSDIGFLKAVADKDGNTSTEFISSTIYAHKDGKYYVDSTDFSAGDVILKDGSTDRYIIQAVDSLEGVYSMNKGYAEFRKISILDKNEDYCIVEEGTRYGIARFDNIVLNASDVRESQITAGGV